ncbi:MAG: hypothetical protein J6125_04450, partial [Clostridia bacterium]|nr:hypothetical protein [Clostridia bacterium]
PRYPPSVGPGAPGHEPASGILAALADNEVGSLSSELDHIQLASIFEYTAVYTPGDPPVFDHWEDANGDPATGIMAKLADLTVADMTNSTTLTNKIKTFTVGDAMDLKYEGGTWYTTYVGPGDPGNEKASGILAALADKEVGSLSSELDNIQLASIFEYTAVYTPGDPPVFDHWEDANGDPATGITAKLADLTVADMTNSTTLTNKIKTFTVGDAMDLRYEGGTWYTTYVGPGDPGNEKASGIIAALADKEVGDLSASIDEIKLGTVFGYTPIYDPGDPTVIDHWEDELGTPVSGLLSCIADSTLATVSDDLEALKIGDILGYKKVAGIWYSTYTDNGDPSDDIKARGIMVAFADYTFNDMSNSAMVADAVKEVYIGDAMGYTPVYDPGDPEVILYWMDGSDQVKGIMGAVVSSRIGDVDSTINNTEIGLLLGYENVGGVWYSTYIGPADPGNVKVTGLTKAISSSRVCDLATTFENMTIADAFDYVYEGGVWYSTYQGPGDPGNVEVDGMLLIIGPGTKLSQIDNRAAAIKDTTPVQDFIDAGMLEIDATTAANLTTIWNNTFITDKTQYQDVDGVTYVNGTPDEGWKNLSLTTYVSWMIDTVSGLSSLIP